MLQQILIFVIFLGPLVFFHELGHFFFARLFGVRVEVFSIGFGPKLFSFKRGDTQYAVSLIPLGGYVKMFGDDPFSEDEMTEEEEKYAYTKKGKWARFWIVFGGPLANFILAFFIYFSLLAFGEKVPEAKVGSVAESSSFYKKGFRSGDVIKTINELEISSFDDFNLLDSKLREAVVSRNGVDKVIPLNESSTEFLTGFSTVSPQLRAPIVADSMSNNYILKIEGKESLSYEELLLVANTNTVNAYLITSDLLSIKKIEDIKHGPEVAYSFQNSRDLISDLRNKNYFSRDLYVSSIVASSPAAANNIKKGDIIRSINGVELYNFMDLRTELNKVKAGAYIELEILTKGIRKKLNLVPAVKNIQGKDYLTIGVYSGIMLNPPRMVINQESSVFIAIKKGFTRTWNGILKTAEGFKKLITGEVSMSNIGGPIAIGKVASDSFNISLSMFFRLMALISINLGLINLFPIPVLDGGHIVFIFLELINRGPLSKKKMMIAQQVGVSLLFALIFFSLFNDVSRFF